MKKFPRLKWFLPLLLLLGLKALMMSMFISGIIKDNVASATGVAAERISVNGRNVTIDGFSSQADADAAELVARDDVAWTADVDTIVDGSAEAPVAGEAVAPASVVLAAESGRVVLSGVVASNDERNQLVEAARTEFEPDREVIDEVRVDSDAVAEGTGEVAVNGLAADEGEKADWIAAATAVASANGFTVIDDVQIDEAEEPVEEDTVEEDTVEDLNALFELAPIEFDTGQATIRPESQVTLDEAAQLIAANPDAGNFRVVGHTDSDGDETQNQLLSEARAQAVVEYLTGTGGVEEARLEAEGRGESELKVTPEESAEDRQQNRRIEWELV